MHPIATPIQVDGPKGEGVVLERLVDLLPLPVVVVARRKVEPLGGGRVELGTSCAHGLRRGRSGRSQAPRGRSGRRRAQRRGAVSVALGLNDEFFHME